MKDLNKQLANIEFIMMNNDNPTGIQELYISEEERLALLTHIAKIRRIEETNKIAYCVSRDRLAELFDYSDNGITGDDRDDMLGDEMDLLSEINAFRSDSYKAGINYQRGQMSQIINDVKDLMKCDKVKSLFKAIQLLCDG